MPPKSGFLGKSTTKSDGPNQTYLIIWLRGWLRNLVKSVLGICMYEIGLIGRTDRLQIKVVNMALDQAVELQVHLQTIIRDFGAANRWRRVVDLRSITKPEIERPILIYGNTTA